MTKYIALLRGINVGGNNKISMPILKTVFEEAGFTNVSTYINSGNIFFNSILDEKTTQSLCEQKIANKFGLNISVSIITASELSNAIANAPDWWNNSVDSKHNAIFVISPATAENICTEVGEVKAEYEKVAYYGKVIFWTAPISTFNKTRWSKITKHRATYEMITIRNAKTVMKLLELAGGN
ncbi:hypothetical protein FACS1894132_11310 [Clostridia bacterium]|nr:hypothetical protein FACS1894132_11310 [Clostridia bacterium]